MKKNGNFALAGHGIEITKNGQSGILDEVVGLHGLEIKKNGSFKLADHGTLADHGVEIKKNGSFKLADQEIAANQPTGVAGRASKQASNAISSCCSI